MESAYGSGILGNSSNNYGPIDPDQTIRDLGPEVETKEQQNATQWTIVPQRKML